MIGVRFKRKMRTGTALLIAPVAFAAPSIAPADDEKRAVTPFPEGFSVELLEVRWTSVSDMPLHRVETTSIEDGDSRSFMTTQYTLDDADDLTPFDRERYGDDWERRSAMHLLASDELDTLSTSTPSSHPRTTSSHFERGLTRSVQFD